MSAMYRLLHWITSLHFLPRRRSTSSSVAPSVNHYSCDEEKTSSGTSSSSATTKQVHFADDRGGALECVHILPLQPTTSSRTFHESLEEVYINQQGVVTGFLKVTNLEAGRNILVRVTTNEWKNYKQIKPRRIAFKPCDDKNNEDANANRNSNNPCWDNHGKEDELTYLFTFQVSRKKLNHVELVIVSTFNGAIDKRHKQCYALSNPQGYQVGANGTYAHCVQCWN